MSSGLSWGNAFPADESAIATKLLVEAWGQLTNSPKTAFTAALSEPKLTDLLCEHLKNISEATGYLTGRWGQENPCGKINAAAGKRVTSFRTDIEYFSNRSTPVLRLVYEFKKIDHTKRTQNKYWGPDGMGRFIDGEYAIKEPVVLMAGIVTSAKANCVSELKSALTSTRCAQLSWRNSERTIEPSQSFPNEAHFDTEHLRHPSKVPATGYIRICHLFLDFPDTPSKLPFAA